MRPQQAISQSHKAVSMQRGRLKQLRLVARGVELTKNKIHRSRFRRKPVSTIQNIIKTNSMQRDAQLANHEPPSLWERIKNFFTR